MRRMQLSSALLALTVLTSSAFGANYNRGGCASCERNSGYGAPACAGPIGYNLSPGCCECPPSACDNAWAGYCQEKARWQAFWTRVGTHKPKCGTTVSYTNVPTPAVIHRLPPVGPQPKATEPAPNGLQPIPEPTPVEPQTNDDNAYPPLEKPLPREALRRWKSSTAR